MYITDTWLTTMLHNSLIYTVTPLPDGSVALITEQAGKVINIQLFASRKGCNYVYTYSPTTRLAETIVCEGLADNGPFLLVDGNLQHTIETLVHHLPC